ncbi:MAG: efflux RND transporter periplasmic adaptor subunit [Gammaproteobacteria bacterium]|nr:efflux RND transporter periplasmic adaptor subunit [Gammaproteobacteria bacterium]
MNHFLIPIIPLIVFASLLLSACDSGQTPAENTSENVARPAKIVSLTENVANLQRTYPGILEASQQADLAFRVSGQLIELAAFAGLHVIAGDLLAQLDPSDYQNTLAERQARFDLAETQLDQAKKLLEKNLSSQLLFDKANAEFKSARAALQQARDNLRYTSLKAPFDGVIARVEIENYQPVQAQLPVIHIRSDRQLDIRFSVPESMIARLKRVDDPEVINSFCGQVTLVTHPNKSYRACHKEHESIPDPLTRNYAALFRLDEISDFVILPGMTATIELDFSRFLADRADHVVYAPVESVLSEENRTWLWQLDAEMRARKIEVTLGRIEGGRVEITSRIDPQKSIIAAGVSYVREGMLVKPIVKQRGL